MIRKVLPFAVLGVLVLGIVYLPTWDQGSEKVPPTEQPRVAAPELPAGHPPVASSTAPPLGADGKAVDTGTDSDLPLKASGLGSEAELEHILAGVQSAHAKEAFEEGFRLCFTTVRERRDYLRAKEMFEHALEDEPDLAAAYRGLAYAELNTTFDFPKTIALYEKAVEIDPNYGEAHYALSFKRALELGIEDERSLKEQFYPNVE